MPVRAAELETRLYVADREFNRGLADAERRAGRFASSVNSSFSRAGQGLGGASGLLPGLSHISNVIQAIPQIGNLAGALVNPLKEAAEQGIRFNMLIESAEVGFQGITGGAQQSAKYVKELTDFAARNPIFNTQGTIEAARMMAVFGFETQKTTDYLKAWGGAMAASGKFNSEALTSVARSFGTMRALGRVNAEEMNELANRGIPGWELLAKAIGKTVEETRKLGEQGKLRGGPAVDAITAMLKTDPRFGGLADAFANTLEGRLAQLEDLREVAAGKGTKNLTTDINDALAGALAGGGPELAQRMAEGFNTAIAPVSGLIKGAIVTTIGGGMTSGFEEAINAAKAVLPAQMMSFGTDAIIAPLKSVLGIQSPSTVTRWMGQMLGEGFEQGALSRLDEAQRRIIQKIVEIGRQVGATADEIKAALATGWVESRFRNLPKGDRDSLGVFQQRPSQGWGTPEQLMDPDYAARQFYAEAQRRRGRGLEPGALAQSVQRSAYPDRYAEALPFVNQVVQSLGSGSGIEPGRVRKAWEVLAEFAEMRGFTVTSTTGGKHNAGSLHGRGLAVDIRTRDKSPGQVAALMAEARAAGISVKDERTRPPGQKVWGGPHLHLSLPNGLVSTANPMPVAVVGSYGGRADLGGGAVGMFAEGLLDLPVARDLSGLVSSSLQPSAAFSALGTGGDPKQSAFELLKAIGQIGPEAEKSFGQASGATRDWAKEVIQAKETTMFLGLELRGIASSFEDAFSYAFTQTELGFKGMASAFLLEWSRMLQQMAVQALSARLTESLFGSFGASGKSEGGGWLSQLANFGASALSGLFGGGASPGGLGSAFGGMSFATGTPSAPAGWAMVGEQGPELVRLRGGERIYNNRDTERLLNARPAKQTVFNNTYNISAPAPRDRGYIQKRSRRDVAETIANTLKQRVA